MPLNLGYFIIRKPKVSYINENSTTPPTSQGNYSVFPGFKVRYNGSASTAQLTIAGKYIRTIIDENPYHPDNFEVLYHDRTIQMVIDDINIFSNYQAIAYAGTANRKAYIITADRVDINNVFYDVQYNIEIEFLIDIYKEGNLGSSSVSWKKDYFIFSGENNRWVPDVGYIYDYQDSLINSSGIANLDAGVQIKFSPTIYTSATDVSRIVPFADIKVTSSLQQPTNEFSLPAAPILIPDSFVMKINTVPVTENQDYVIYTGSSSNLEGNMPSPYFFTTENNIFKIRYDYDAVQEFELPLGRQTARDLYDFLSPLLVNIKISLVLDTLTSQTFLGFSSYKGSFLHQVRIEDGSANSTLGFNDFQGVRGSGTGTVKFLTYIPEEVFIPTSPTSDFVLEASTQHGLNFELPFLGINLDSVKIYENNNIKKLGTDYLIEDNGYVNLIQVIKNEKLFEGILTLDTDLFKDDYAVYDNGQLLKINDDYNINTNAGWINLTKSAFPGHVFTVDYRNIDQGTIVGEILLGTQATLTSSKVGPYNFIPSNQTFILSINNGPEQTFLIPAITGFTTQEVVDSINSTASGFYASVSYDFKIILTTNVAGPNSSIVIGNGSANNVLGFFTNESNSGTGAKGGEKAFDVKYPAMEVGGFTAPIGGDTFVIKNMDVLSNYQPGAIFQIFGDLYQVKNSYLDTTASLISSTAFPASILEGTNDTFYFTVDNNPETKVVLSPIVNRLIEDVVAEINAAFLGVAEVSNLNGVQRIKLKAASRIKIGNGNANRTLGFEGGQEDTNSADTIITVTSFFKYTYVSPSVYTSKIPIDFVIDNTPKLETPQNYNSLKFVGDLTLIYTTNIIVKVGAKHHHRVITSSFDGTYTTVSLETNLVVPIYTDTLIEKTIAPILYEGTTELRTTYLLLTQQPFSLIKNGTPLSVNVDYNIDDGGFIVLKKGIVYGDTFFIDYVGRRFIDSTVTVKSNYTYFTFAPKGTSIDISYIADSPDNFYIRVMYAYTLMTEFQKELLEQIQNTANPSSHGLPTGEVVEVKNYNQGVDSLVSTIGNLDDKINLSLDWFTFFDNRIYYMETERQNLNGYLIGAEDGRVTIAQLEDSANPPPTRLFILEDTRPYIELSEPLRVPAFDSLNQNDEGNSTLGINHLNTVELIDRESIAINAERAKLVTLSGMSVTNSSISSSGDFLFTGGESITLYIEAENPAGFLNQRNVVVSFSSGASIVNPFPPPAYLIVPYTAATVRDTINLAVNAAFGFTVDPATAGGSVYLNAYKTGNPTRCVYVLADTPHLNFGVGSTAAIRSRHPLWTGGWTYTMTVPGVSSVHTDIIEEDYCTGNEISLHSANLSYISGQMEEWLPSFDVAYNLAKAERSLTTAWLNDTTTFKSASDSFDALKDIGNDPFGALDNISVINNRISDLNNRQAALSVRRSRALTRASELGSLLASESLFDQRYAWVNILCHRENGLYQQKKRLVDAHDKDVREATNNQFVLDSMKNY